MELDEQVVSGGTRPGTDGWSGRVAVKGTKDGRAYFQPDMPRAATRLDAEGLEAFIAVQRGVQAVRDAQMGLEERVEWARDAGVSWALIGWCLGLTGEAARKRWGLER